MASFTAIQIWGSTFFRLFGWRSVKLNGETGSVDVTYKRRSKVSEITTMVDYYGTKNVEIMDENAFYSSTYLIEDMLQINMGKVRMEQRQ